VKVESHLLEMANNCNPVSCIRVITSELCALDDHTLTSVFRGKERLAAKLLMTTAYDCMLSVRDFAHLCELSPEENIDGFPRAGRLFTHLVSSMDLLVTNGDFLSKQVGTLLSSSAYDRWTAEQIATKLEERVVSGDLLVQDGPVAFPALASLNVSNALYVIGAAMEERLQARFEPLNSFLLDCVTAIQPLAFRFLCWYRTYTWVTMKPQLLRSSKYEFTRSPGIEPAQLFAGVLFSAALLLDECAKTGGGAHRVIAHVRTYMALEYENSKFYLRRLAAKCDPEDD